MSQSAPTVKKTYNLPPDRVARARRALKARTETEAVIRSLEEVLHEEEIHRAVRRSSGRLAGFQPLR